MPTVEEFIERFCQDGEEDTVGENLTLNRGPARPEDLDAMQASIPDGTIPITPRSSEIMGTSRTACL